MNLAIRVLAGVGVATSFVASGRHGHILCRGEDPRLWEGGVTSVLFYVMAIVTAAAFLIVAYWVAGTLAQGRGRTVACSQD